ncbi:hypothetical protein LTR53_011284 [Teratosphaeriaceae sp. CCFEE 6253]|nr:hypothetical protein LTR53_011284 [Teratosphaeriaceae sp. CCFEE 6253]
MDPSVDFPGSATSPSLAETQGFTAACLAECVQSLHESDEYSDLTIVCGDDTYKVHKAIVCTQSPVLRAACKAGTLKEGAENTIALFPLSTLVSDDDLDRDDPAAVRRMIHFLSHGDYDVAPWREYTCGDDNAGHARVFAVAVKYGLEGLRALAAAHYADVIRGYPGDCSHQDVAAAVRIVHATTPPEVEELRTATCSLLLRDSAELLWWGCVRAAINSVDGLGFELMLLAVEQRNRVSGVLMRHRQETDCEVDYD